MLILDVWQGEGKSHEAHPWKQAQNVCGYAATTHISNNTHNLMEFETEKGDSLSLFLKRSVIASQRPLSSTEERGRS